MKNLLKKVTRKFLKNFSEFCVISVKMWSKVSDNCARI